MTSKKASCENEGGHRSSLKQWLDETSFPVYILIMCFALSSWIDINGLWVEIPLLVEALPEGWNLPSYIIMIIQFANIGPLIYTILVRLWPHRVKEWPVIYVIISIGALSCLALIFYWDVTTVINGTEHSTGLFTLTFFLSLVDCTSSVVYLPYMALLKPQYMTSFYIGEGLSGLIPGVVGLMQGVGGDPDCVNQTFIVENATTGINETDWEIIPIYKPPNFTIEVFFFILFLMILTSAFAFTCIHFMPFGKRERVKPVGLYDFESERKKIETKYENSIYQDVYQKADQDVPKKADTKQALNGNVKESNGPIGDSTTMVNGANSYYKSVEDILDSSSVQLTNADTKSKFMGKHEFVYLLVLTAWINGLSNGVLPSTQSYSCLPYGNLAYTLTVRLSTVANPLACFSLLLLPLPSVRGVSVLTGLGTLLAAYQLLLAALSPEPPLQEHVMGQVLVITSAVVLTAFFTVAKVSIASILRVQGGRTALIWCGGVTQVGSFIGAIITFVVVNVFQLFESAPTCPV